MNSFLVFHVFYGLYRVSKLWLVGQIRPAICFCKNIGAHLHPFIHILSIPAFALLCQSWVFVTETMCPAKPKILTIWTFYETVCQSMVNTNLKISILGTIYVVSNSVPEPAHLMRADCVHLFSPIHSVMSCWQLEISHGWSIHTNEHHKSDYFSTKSWSLNLFQHTIGSNPLLVRTPT